MAPSQLVRAPRVKESPAQLECKVTEIIQLRDMEGNLTPRFLVMGQVIGIHSQIWENRDQNVHVSMAPFLRSWEAMQASQVIKTWGVGAGGYLGVATRMSDAVELEVADVIDGSPAQKAGVRVGDVILGVAGKPFSYDPRTEFGKAITAAETEGKLALTRWRAGKEEQVVVALPVLGAYSATAPYDCEKSRRILEQGCKALALRMADENYPKSQNAITQRPRPPRFGGRGAPAPRETRSAMGRRLLGRRFRYLVQRLRDDAGRGIHDGNG
jgi:hypothetical protein